MKGKLNILRISEKHLFEMLSKRVPAGKSTHVGEATHVWDEIPEDAKIVNVRWNPSVPPIGVEVLLESEEFGQTTDGYGVPEISTYISLRIK